VALAKLRSDMIAALDVGSTKICCFIAQREEGGAPRVVGIGHQVAKGIRSGAITDMEQARNSILAAVQAAEEMAGDTIREVFINVSTGQPSSKTFGVEVPVTGHEVSPGDVRRVLDQGRQSLNGGEREVIHSIPVGFTVDGSNGIQDPRGMYGQRLGVHMHIVSAAAGPVRNLANCVAGCHLDVAAFVVSPFASGLSCLVEDEMELGATLIDMGGGTTSFAVFSEGELIFTDTVSVGGQHVTTDIAHGMSTPLAHAERMKTLYGSAIASTSDSRAVIDVPQIGDDQGAAPNHVPKSLLVGIIQPRIEETFELVRDRLEAAGLANGAGRRVVLVGGASQLHGVRDVAAQVLDKQARLGRPARLAGLAEATAGPAFATCAGLLGYALSNRALTTVPTWSKTRETRGLLGRIGHWLEENF
jgi:cell division protein FtsA